MKSHEVMFHALLHVKKKQKNKRKNQNGFKTNIGAQNPNIQI